MSTSPKRRALGRGLSALLPTAPANGDTGDAPKRPGPRAVGRRAFFSAPVEEIYPNPDQPRKRFAEAELEELAESLRTHGIIQPLAVRERPEADGGGFYLIAGERRWRAAQRAGLREVPVVVQEVSSTEAFERALVENLQRSDLNPMEEAEAYHRLVEEHGYTQEQVAERVGKERSTVANSLRLLRLPKNVRGLVEDSSLSMGHARALLALGNTADMEIVARTILAKGLSVRATEELIRKRNRGGEGRKSSKTSAQQKRKKSAAVRDLENRLTKALGASVTLAEDSTGKGGSIEIRYLDLDDLDRLLERLLRAR